MFSQSHKNKEVFSFEYDPEWLRENPVSFFDSDLQLYSGRQFVEQDELRTGALRLKTSPAEYIAQPKKNVACWKQIASWFDITRSAILKMESCIKV